MKYCSDTNHILYNLPKLTPAELGTDTLKEDISLLKEQFQSLYTRFLRQEEKQKTIDQYNADANKRADQVYESLTKYLNDNLNKLHSFIQESLSNYLQDQQKQHDEIVKQSPQEVQLAELWAASQQNRQALMDVMTKQNLFSQNLTSLQALVQNIQQLQKHVETPSNTPAPVQEEEVPSKPVHTLRINQSGQKQPLDGDVRLKEHRQLASTVDGLDNRVSMAMQDIFKIKNEMNKHEKDVRDVVLAIVDEFKLIHGNAQGLENLPPLNLANCVPSYFNNPSFTFDREQESNDSSAYESERSNVSINRNSSPDDSNKSTFVRSPHHTGVSYSPAPETRRISGLMHLVSKPGHSGKKIIYDKSASDNSSQKSQSVTIPEDALERYRGMAKEEVDHLLEEQQQKMADHLKKIDEKNKYNQEELSKLMTQFISNKNELMSAVDRKVDRDTVERVYNKFRTVVAAMNDRVVELAKEIPKMATQTDLDQILHLVTHSIHPDSGSCVKKGPVCLTCGKETQITGQISVQQAYKNNGTTQPIQTISGTGNSDVVYGDNGNLKGNSMDSIPRFKLPPLKDTDVVST